MNALSLQWINTYSPYKARMVMAEFSESIHLLSEKPNDRQ